MAKAKASTNSEPAKKGGHGSKGNIFKGSRKYISTPPSSDLYMYNMVHQAARDISRQKKAVVAKTDAIFLEDILNIIAGYNIENYDRSNYTIKNRTAAITKSLSKLLGNNFQNQFGIANSSVLRALGLKKDTLLTGTNFEDYLGYLFNNIKRAFAGESLTKSYSRKSMGQRRVTLEYDVTNEIMHDLHSAAYKVASKKSKEAMKAYADNLEFAVEETIKGSFEGGKTYSSTTSAKTDTAIAIETVAIPTDFRLKKLAELLKKATFSDKAYKFTTEITLGDTNPYRAYASIASMYGGVDELEKYYRFFRTIGCMYSKSHAHNRATILSFYMMRYIYELTGYGQHYVEKQLDEQYGALGAEYIIFHKAQGTKRIRVLSTSAIINDLIDDIETAAGQIWSSKSLEAGKNSITAAYAINAKLKLRYRNNKFEFGGIGGTDMSEASNYSKQVFYNKKKAKAKSNTTKAKTKAKATTKGKGGGAKSVTTKSKNTSTKSKKGTP